MIWIPYQTFQVKKDVTCILIQKSWHHRMLNRLVNWSSTVSKSFKKNIRKSFFQSDVRMLKGPGLKSSSQYISVFQGRPDRGGGALNMFKNMFDKSSKIRKRLKMMSLLVKIIFQTYFMHNILESSTFFYFGLILLS